MRLLSAEKRNKNESVHSCLMFEQYFPTSTIQLEDKKRKGSRNKVDHQQQTIDEWQCVLIDPIKTHIHSVCLGKGLTHTPKRPKFRAKLGTTAVTL